MTRQWDEQLEATGYDETWGSSNVTGGNTLDPDQVTSGVTGAPATWGNQCLKLDLTAASTNANIRKSAFTGFPIWYFRTEIIVESESLIDNQQNNFFELRIGTSPRVRLMVRQESGSLLLRAAFWHNGSQNSMNMSTPSSISLATPYRFETLWDGTNDLWEWRIDGVTQNSGTLTGTAAGETLDDLSMGSTGAVTAAAWTYYLDNIAVDDADWVGAESGAPTGRVFDETFEGAGTVESWTVGP